MTDASLIDALRHKIEEWRKNADAHERHAEVRNDPYDDVGHEHKLKAYMLRKDAKEVEALLARLPVPQEASEDARTVRSIAAMLGWENVPPRRTLEMEISALKARAASAPPLVQPDQLGQAWVSRVTSSSLPDVSVMGAAVDRRLPSILDALIAVIADPDDEIPPAVKETLVGIVQQVKEQQRAAPPLVGSGQEDKSLKNLANVAANPNLRVKGWDTYNAEPLDDRAVSAAYRFLSSYAWAAVPTSDGGVQLERHDSECDIEISWNADGTFDSIFAQSAAGGSGGPDGPPNEDPPERCENCNVEVRPGDGAYTDDDVWLCGECYADVPIVNTAQRLFQQHLPPPPGEPQP